MGQGQEGQKGQGQPREEAHGQGIEGEGKEPPVPEQEGEAREEGPRGEALPFRRPWGWVGGEVPKEQALSREEKASQGEGQGLGQEEEGGGQEVPQAVPQELGRLQPSPLPLQPLPGQADQEGVPGGEVQGQDGLEEESQGQEEGGLLGEKGEEAEDPGPKPDAYEEEGPAVQPVQEEAGEEVQGQGEVGEGGQEGQGPGPSFKAQEQPEAREG